MKILLLFITTIFSTNAFCCGSTAQQFMSYWSATDLESKEEFLKGHGCSLAMNYDPLVADEVIVKVLVDAIDKKVKSNLISNIIKNHNCLFGARKIPEYASIKKFISNNGLSDYCDKDRLAYSYVVISKGGINLRSGPSINSEKVGTIADGALVKILSNSNDWALVESYSGKGYVYTPLLKPL
jgi:hypothetical protein